ncbi:CTD kinase subunit beta [Cryptococcus neoformans]|nr:CTD kinase subunit beta [Cryptococcus neoformans var. grubii]OXC58759.1 CTD kinase subunit beta [Cryptococcus neoformans var. grubii MW-RSA852]
MIMTEVSSSASATHTKQYKPYFSPANVEKLSAKQRGKLSVSREERVRQQACGFIDAVGVRCGFPRRTIATAQTLYMRFHLFFPYKDFSYIEVALATLYVSSKLHDTLKKPRDIILASFPIRFPHLLRKGIIDPSVAQAHGLDSERARILSIERLVLESMAFKFSANDGLRPVIKIGKKLGLSKDFCKICWKVAVDSYRTPAPLSYPPHIIALGSIYTAALLTMESLSFETPEIMGQTRTPRWIVELLGNTGSWEEDYVAGVTHVDEVVHALLDLYHTVLSNPENQALQAPSPVSPKEPLGSIAPTLALSSSGTTAFPLSAFWTPQTLTKLKINLRERSGGLTTMLGWATEDTGETDKIAEGMGKNDVTIRFLWDEDLMAMRTWM